MTLLWQPSAVETDSDEYRVYNDTESDLEVEKGVVVIKDLESVQVYKVYIFSSPYDHLMLLATRKLIDLMIICREQLLKHSDCEVECLVCNCYISGY